MKHVFCARNSSKCQQTTLRSPAHSYRKFFSIVKDFVVKISVVLRKLGLVSVAVLGVTGCSEFFVRKAQPHTSLQASKVVFDADTYPAVVLGGGMGGMTAGVYLAMANIKTLLVQGTMPGGLLTQSLSVRNWPGELESPGMAITDKLLAQARKQGVEIAAEKVTALDTTTWPYRVTLSDVSDTSRVRTVKALSVVIGMGALSNYLGIPGEKEYWSKGVTNCAVCEGSLYKDKVVCVVGGGNSAIEEAHYLAGIARKVYVFVRRDVLRATDNRKDDLATMKNVEIVYTHALQKIIGNGQQVTGVSAINTTTNTVTEYPMDGVFLAIGFTPNTALFKDSLALTQQGYIALKHDQQTSVPGIFAVGDIVDPVYKQAVTAAGDGCRAALQAHQFLQQCGYTPKPVEAAQTAPVSANDASEKKKEITESTAVASVESASEPVAAKHTYTPGVAHEMKSTQEVLDLIATANKPVIIDFHAVWCGPCRQMAPMYSRLAERYADKAIFIKINIDDLGGFATQYRIQGVPTFVFIKEGVEKHRIVGGGSTEKQFAEKIDALI
jgi:thioredoxin reductase (NADPH)